MVLIYIRNDGEMKADVPSNGVNDIVKWLPFVDIGMSRIQTDTAEIVVYFAEQTHDRLDSSEGEIRHGHVFKAYISFSFAQ